MLELSGLFVCAGGLLSLSVPGVQKKLFGCGLLGESVPRLTLWMLPFKSQPRYSRKIKM